MNGRQWTMAFFNSLDELKKQSNIQSYPKWTKFMIAKVIERVGKKMNSRVCRKRYNKRGNNGEYLNIDAMFIKNLAYNIKNDYDSKNWDPPVLPDVVVEHEHENKGKIIYCLWKIMCIRSKVRVLICYQKNEKEIKSLIKSLEKPIRQRKLMEEDKGDLIVIVGNSERDKSKWERRSDILKYFSAFKWQDNGFKKYLR